MVKQSQCQVIPINRLPDDVLLEIFDFYVVKYPARFLKWSTEEWQLLVHVSSMEMPSFCISTSPESATHCNPQAAMSDKLYIWPALPLLIQGSISPSVVDKILAVLKRHDRVSMIHLDSDYSRTTPEVRRVWTAMQVPFPELTVLRLRSSRLNAPIIPDSFLGGSSPHLREIWLTGIPFPGLPKLLLSATLLTEIHLEDITRSGYISPETMVTCVSALTSLKKLYLKFLLRSRPDSECRHPPSPTRSILPALTDIQFEGTSEYLEDLVARIDTPQLNTLFISLINQIDLGVPQLAQFMSRTPMFKALDEARICFCGDAVQLELSSPTSGFLKIEFSCGESDRQLSILVLAWTSFSPFLSMLDNLFIYEDEYLQPHWQDNIDNNQWLELLRPFTSVESLYVSKELVAGIMMAALQEPARVTEVLPILRNLFLEGLRRLGYVQGGIRLFVAARQFYGLPVAVSRWIKDKDIDSDSDWEI